MLGRAASVLAAAIFAAALGVAAARSLAGPWPVPLPAVPLAPPGAAAPGPGAAAAPVPGAAAAPERETVAVRGPEAATAPGPGASDPGGAGLPPEMDTWPAAQAAIAAAPADRRQGLAEDWVRRLRRAGAPLARGGSATFFYWGPAERVYLSGDMNAWQETDLARVAGTDLWHVTIPLPEDVVLAYRLVVDGRSQTDPLNPRQTRALGTRFSLHLGPAATAAPDIPAAPAAGARRRFHLDSRHLGYPVGITVHLPPGCTAAHPCPAVYVLDGPFYLDEGRLAQALALEAGAGRLPPLAVVAVDSSDNPLQRLEELLPGLVRSSDTLAFLAEELIPHAEAAYPLRRGRAHRALLGMSAGAGAAVQAALDRPDAFGRVVAQSPAVLPFLHQRARRAAQAGPPSGGWPAVYVSWGRYETNIFGLDITAEAGALAAELAGAGLPVQRAEWPAGHNMAAWRRTVGPSLAAVWPDQPPLARPAGAGGDWPAPGGLAGAGAGETRVGAQFPLEAEAGAVEAGLDGARWQVQEFGHLFIGAALELQGHDGAERGRQALDGPPDGTLHVVLLGCLGRVGCGGDQRPGQAALAGAAGPGAAVAGGAGQGPGAGVTGLVPLGRGPGPGQRAPAPAAQLVVAGAVDNAHQPGGKGRVAPVLVQPGVRPDERILHHVHGIRLAPQQPHGDPEQLAMAAANLGVKIDGDRGWFATSRRIIQQERWQRDCGRLLHEQLLHGMTPRCPVLYTQDNGRTAGQVTGRGEKSPSRAGVS